MQLLDACLPAPSFSERHHLDTAADPAVLIRAAAAYRPESDPMFRAAIAVREMPMRLGARLSGRKPSEAPAAFGYDRFTLIEHRPAQALVYGLAGRLWRPDYGLAAIADATAFRAFDEAGAVKLVLGIWVEGGRNGRTRLTTETRILCPDAGSRRRFAPYWYLIRPVSGLIRRRMLAAIARAAAPD